MIDSFVPVNEPVLNGNEARYLQDCIDTGWISSEGPFIERFEAAMGTMCGRTNAVAVANGSLALDIAVEALSLPHGSEVILPAFTIISCAAAIVRAGLKPVVVDCDPLTWNMTAAGVEKALTPQTSAIMLVHIYGLPVDMDPILEIARRHDLRVIEDAAEMHGQTYRGKPCGGFGDISIFSFYPNKHITTGEGGMVLCNDESLASTVRGLRNLCFEPGRRFVHTRLGWNARMTNMQAAIGVAQSERIDQIIEKKRHIGSMYNEILSDDPRIELQTITTDYAENIYWVYGLVLKESVGVEADVIMQRLAARKVGSRPFFWCMHEQPVFRDMGLFEHDRHPNAERIARRGLYLPSGLALTDDQIAYSAFALKDSLSERI